MNINLIDGSQIEIPDGSSVYDLAKKIGTGLAKAAVAGKVNKTLVDLTHKLEDSDSVEIITFDSPEGKSVFWHSSAHVMAEAVKNLFPEAKVAIGPAIEQGFYYDFEVERPFTQDDLERIEKEFMRIVREKRPFYREEVSKQEAESLFRGLREKYKLELLEDLEGPVTIYSQNGWKDLCRGPHLPDTGKIKAVKLLNSSGAYWRGDENREMLQRIYGISFPKKSMLDEYLNLLEEAKKREHKKLGRELDLFSFHKEGVGFPFWHSKGMVLYNEVMNYCRYECEKRGYSEIKTPVILNEELWKNSGHWDKYKENMYFTEIDETVHAVKPMNCPGGLLIFKNNQHSYRDLPLRNYEFGLVHRHEKSAVLNGLFRVRQFTQDDAHIFCTPEQLEDEIQGVIDFITTVYERFGFRDVEIELSTRPEQYIGSIDVWDKAENALESVLKSQGIDYKLNPGDGAFYGPKIDFHIRDSLKRSWQCGTIQVDFSMPQRFGLEYTDDTGEKRTPVMIHRAILGSLERFIGILIEHYGGNFPVWMAPVQVKVIPVSDKTTDYAESVRRVLEEAGIRSEIDLRSEKIGYKIRGAETDKVPYMLITGQKEEENNQVSVRKHRTGDMGSKGLTDFIAGVSEEIEQKRISE